MTGTRANKDNENLYQMLVLNDVYKQENKMAHMENWSILSNNIRYVNYDVRSKATHKLDMKTFDYQQHKRLYLNLKGEESQTIDADFGSNPETIKSNY